MDFSKALAVYITFTLASTFTTLGKIYNDGDVSARIPTYVKKKIDDLVNEKVEMYEAIFFSNSIENLDGNLNNKVAYADSSLNIKRIKSRIRRHSSSNGSIHPVDGGYSHWTAFGPCSASCGRGEVQRYRTCTAPSPQNNGKNCSALGPATDIRYCNLIPCIVEKYILDGFVHISSAKLQANILVLKQFSVGDDKYLGVLSDKNLQIYKWDYFTHSFSIHQQTIAVYNARSFDVYSYIVDHYIILAEAVKHSRGVDFFTRVLSYNEITKKFDFRKQIMLPLPFANKVVAFNVFGQPHAAFIQYQSKAPGQKISKTICDHQSATITCFSGSRISIQSAFYGRDSWSVCNHGWFFNIRPCSTTLILEKVVSMCNNRTKCVLKAPPDGITDPCPVFTKYLTVTYTCDRIMYSNIPRFYVWKAVSFQVIPSDSLVTFGATDIEAFDLHHKHFVAVANYVNDEGSHHLDSEIFIYSSNLKKFISFQRLRTDAALDWEFFSIGEGLATEYFLVVANNFKLDKTGNRQYYIDSVIYKWNWNLFVPFQCIKAYGARKWSAAKGSDGEFLLVLSSFGSRNITFYEYDGWRFNPSEIPLKSTYLQDGPSVAQSLRVKNATMLLIHTIDGVGSSNNHLQHLFRINFEKAYPAYNLFNTTVTRVEKINGALESLNNHLLQINDSIYSNRSKMMWIKENTTITGCKYFTNIQLPGVLETFRSVLGIVNLSWKDRSIVKRHGYLQQEILNDKSKLTRLANLTSRRLSKRQDQVIHVPFAFKNLTPCGSIEASNVNFFGNVYGEDIKKITNESLYADKNQTIHGIKTFASSIFVRRNLTVREEVGGINMSLLVTLCTDQVISGKKRFIGDICFSSEEGSTNTVIVKLTLDSTPLTSDHVMTISEDQALTGSYRFLEVIALKRDLVVSWINGVDMSNLYADTVLYNTMQIVQGRSKFTGLLKIHSDLKILSGKKIDNVDVSKVKITVISRYQNQAIYYSVLFNNRVTFKNLLTLKKRLNGINLANDILYLSKEQEVAGPKYFKHDVDLKKNIDIRGLINGVDISGDLLHIVSNQVVTGKKAFDVDLAVYGNVEMVDIKTVDGVDLSKLSKQSVYKNLKQVIYGDIIFSSISAANVVINCNGSCSIEELLNDLRKKTVKSNIHTSVLGKKTFKEDVILLQNINVDGLINDITILRELIMNQTSEIIRGEKVFKFAVHINDVATIFGMLNGIYVSQMYHQAFLIDGSQVLDGLKNFVDMNFDNDVHVFRTINGLKFLKDVVKRENNETITAEKIFKQLSVETLTAYKMQILGFVDDVDIIKLHNTMLKSHGNQSIAGYINFESGFNIAGNLLPEININGFNLTKFSLDTLKMNGIQTVTSKKRFIKAVAVANILNVDGKVDSVSLKKLHHQAVTLNENQIIHGEVNFATEVAVKDDTEIDGGLNKINTTRLKSESLFLYGNQIIYGAYNFTNANVKGNIIHAGKINNFYFDFEVVNLGGNETLERKVFTERLVLEKDLMVDGQVNGVDIKKLYLKAVFLNGMQVIQAKKIFLYSVYIKEDIDLKGFIDHVNVTDLEWNALTPTKNQAITSVYIFKGNVKFSNFTTIARLINDIHINEFRRNVVTKSTRQVLLGSKIFDIVTVFGDISVKNAEVTRNVNGVNLEQIKRNSVRLSGKNYIIGKKRFSKDARLNGGMFVNGTINEILFVKELVLLSSNQSIMGKNSFVFDLIIYGNIDTKPAVALNDIDVSELASNAVYLHDAQHVFGPVHFINMNALKNITATVKINCLNISEHHLLLKNRAQAISAKKLILEVTVIENLSISGEINGVQVLALNQTSVFPGRHNNFIVTKEVFGNLRMKGNISVEMLDGIRIKNMFMSYARGTKAVKTKVFRLNQIFERQKAALEDYIESIKPLFPKLDYFVADQTLKLPITVQSFDAVVFNNNVIITTLDVRNGFSSLYHRDPSTGKFYRTTKMSSEGGSDVTLFSNGSMIYVVISGKASFSTLLEQSIVYSLDSSTFKITEKQRWHTKQATQSDVIKFNHDLLVTFTNSYDLNAEKDCVSSTPLKINSTYHLTPVVSIFGCSIKKVITWQIDSKNFLLVSLNSGLYGGREAVVYRINMNGTYSVIQRIPTFYSSDALFVKIKNELFLIIANEYQKSDFSFLTEYNVPVQIYRFHQLSSRFQWYQDLKVPGATILASFKIHRYTYLIVASSIQAIKVFQFMGSGQFSVLNSVLNNGPKHIKKIRAWTEAGEIYVALLTAIHSQDQQNILSIFRAVKTGSTSATRIHRSLQKVSLIPKT